MNENIKNYNNNTKMTSKQRYDAKTMRIYSTKCHITNDYDIIDYIEKQSNKSDFIKKAIRYYIKNMK